MWVNEKNKLQQRYINKFVNTVADFKLDQKDLNSKKFEVASNSTWCWVAMQNSERALFLV